MTQMFKKAAVFTDIHFGMRQNSKAHNEDCTEFVKWFCKTAQENNCDTAIFMGDWHHHRATVNVSTLNYTVDAIDYISKHFERFFFIPGNHDLYYREKRDLNSVPFIKNQKNIVLVNDVYTEGEVSLVPWLVGDEWTKMKRLDSRYVFGHFELPSFKMNAMVEMPDHGGLNTGHFPNQEMVFSGHFHLRQQRGNVIYTGNAFPHNFADAWDDDRGMMILEFGGQPQYIAWPNAPKFKTIDLTKLIESPEKYMDANTFIRITCDADISYEEANYLKESWQETFNLREVSLIPIKKEEHAQDWSGDVHFESVDQIVLSQLSAIESEVIDRQVLIDIYNQLHV
jgi:DNA repair exonuclease SbcCD nuclease subunit